jgi:hypothetical protein
VTRLVPLELERIRHVPSEWLLSRDLSDQLSGDRELLWWHQRAVHRPGVAAGMTVRSDPGNAADGVGPSVTVDPGLAYDAQGHELPLLERRVLAVPDAQRVTALLVRRAPGGAGVELVWRPLGALEPCDGIPLATLRDGVVRTRTTRTRSLERPHVAAGETQPGATAWGVWREEAERAVPFGLEVRVDTSAAGFTDVPCYFAWLNWPRPGHATPERTGFAPMGLQYVQEEGARGFTFRLRVALRRAGAAEMLAFARRERLSVCWLAVQCEHEQLRSKRRRHVPVR